MRARTLDGGRLTPGVNVDRVDIAAGLVQARAFGWTSAEDEMVVVYALQCWARGEEVGAERTWLSYSSDFTSWRVILAAAVTSADRAAARKEQDAAWETYAESVSA